MLFNDEEQLANKFVKDTPPKLANDFDDAVESRLARDATEKVESNPDRVNPPLLLSVVLLFAVLE